MSYIETELDIHSTIDPTSGVRVITFSEPLLNHLTEDKVERESIETPTELAEFLTAELQKQIERFPERIFLRDSTELLESPAFRGISNLATAMSTTLDQHTGVPTQGIDQLYELAAQWLTPDTVYDRSVVVMHASTLLAADEHYPLAEIEVSLAQKAGQITLLTFNKQTADSHKGRALTSTCRITEESEQVVVQLQKINGCGPFPLHLLASIGLSQLAEFIAREDIQATEFVLTGEQQAVVTKELAAIHHQLIKNEDTHSAQVGWYDRVVFTESMEVIDLQAQIRSMIDQGKPISREVLKLWIVLRPFFIDQIKEINQATVSKNTESRFSLEELVNVASVIGLLTGFTANALLFEHVKNHESEYQQMEYLIAIAIFLSLCTFLATTVHRSQKAESSNATS